MTNELWYGIFLLVILGYHRRIDPSTGLKNICTTLQQLSSSPNPQNFLRQIPVTPSPSEQLLFSSIKEAYFQASPVQGALRQTTAILNKSQKNYEQKSRFNDFLRWRTALFCLLALAGRFTFRAFAAPPPTPPFSTHLDQGLLLSSLGLLAFCRYIGEKLIPDDWFWHNGFTPQAQAWLRYRFLPQSSGPDPLGDELHSLLKEQNQRGSPLNQERQYLLRRFYRKQQEQIRNARLIFSEALPLVDLFLVGLPALLIIGEPALRFFGGVYSP